MSAYDIPSKNILVEMLIGPDYFPVFCAQSMDHPLEQEEIETTDINSGPNKKFVPGMSSSSVTVSGLSEIDNTSGRISILYLMQQSVRRQIQTFRISLVNQVPGTATLVFDAFIKSTTYSKSNPDLSKCSVELRITGGITFGTIIPPPDEPICETEDPLYLTLAEGAIFVSDVLLEQADVVILNVARSGGGMVETTGTPVAGSTQFKFTGGAGNGKITFDALNPGNPGGEPIYVLYKIDP